MFGNSGVMFGMDGPNMEGTWYNPQTGDSFTVRNSFFEDNEYIVQTTDGRVLGYNQIQNYIKSDAPIEMPKRVNTVDELPSEVAGLIDDSYDAEIAELLEPKRLGSLVQPTTPADTQGVVTSQIKLNEMVVEKALSKFEMPNLQVGIEWENFPKTEAKMLVDLMDVSVDDIVKYYLNQVDVEVTTIMIHDVLRSHIESQLGLTPVVESVPVEEEKPKPTKAIKKEVKSKPTRKNKNKNSE